jgi:hypothetical protein
LLGRASGGGGDEDRDVDRDWDLEKKGGEGVGDRYPLGPLKK